MSWGAEPPADRPKPAGPSNDWERTGVRATKKRNRTLLFSILGGCVLVVVVLIALAPMLAGGFAKGLIESKGSEAIAGRVTVDSVSLSWTGPQTIKSVRVVTPRDERVLRLDVESSAGLLGLAFGSRDLGEVTVSGEAEIVRDANGVSTLDRAITGEPPALVGAGSTTRPAGAGNGPLFTVPEGFAADVTIAGVTVLYRDAALERASSGRLLASGIRDLRGTARIAAGEITTLELGGKLMLAKQGGGAPVDRGQFDLAVAIDGLIGTSGTASLDRATITAEIKSDALGTDALLAFLGDAYPDLYREPGLADRAIGSTVAFSLSGEGSADRFLANLAVRSDSAAISAPALLVGRELIEARQPVTVSLGLEQLSLLSAEARDAVGAGSGSASGSAVDSAVGLGALPEVALTVRTLRWPNPMGDDAPMRRLAFDADASLGEITGTLGERGETSAFRVPPSTITVSSPGLAQGASVAWQTPVEIDGAPSGSVAIDLSAGEILDAQGAFAPAVMLASMQGGATLDNLPTAVAASLARAFGGGAVLEGVNLPQVLGPQLRAGLTARPGPAGSDGSSPTTSLVVSLDSEHATVRADLVSDGSVITSASSTSGGSSDAPVRVELRRPAGLFNAGARLGGMPDTTITLASPFVLTADRVSVRTADLSQGLGAVDLSASVSIDETNAVVKGTPVALRGVSLAFGLDQGAVSASGGLRVGANSSPLGRVTAENLRVTLGDAPAVAGSLSMTEVPVAFVEAFAGGGLDLASIIGPTLEGRLTSAPANGGTNPGATDLDATITGALVSGRAMLRLDSDSVRATGEGIRVTHTAPRALVERFSAVDPSVLRFENAGRIEVRSMDFAYDLSEGDAAPLARATGRAEIDASGLRAQTTAGAMAVNTLRTTATLKSGGVVDASFTASLARAGASFGGEGSATVTGLDRPDTAPVIDGALTLTGVPTDLVAAFIPQPVQTSDGPVMSAADRSQAIVDAIGPSFDVELSLRPGRENGRDTAPAAQRLAANIRAQGLTGEASAVLPAGGGFAEVRDLAANVSVTLAPGLVDSLAGAFAGESAATLPRIAERGDLRIEAQRTNPTDPLKITATSRRLALTRVPGMPDPAGVVSVSGLRAEFEGDPAAFDAESFAETGGTKPLRASVAGTLSDASGGRAGALDASVTGGMGVNGPTGAWTGQVNATGVAGAWLDRVLGGEGRASGLVGRSADLRVDAQADLRGRRVRGEGGVGEITKTDIQTGRLTLNLSGELLDAPRPLVLEIRDGALRSNGAWEVQSRTTPAALNAWLVPEEGPRAISVMSVRPVRLSIEELTLPVGEDTRPVATRGPDGVPVRVKLGLTTLELAMQTNPRDTEAPVTIAYANPTLKLQLQTAGGGAVTGQASILADQLRPEARERAIAITVDAENLRSPTGGIAPAQGVYSSDIRLAALPSPLIDALGGLNLWLTDVVGPTLTVQGRLVRVSQTDGRVSLGVVGDNAELTYSGTVRGGGGDAATGRLVSENSPRIVMHTISDTASARIREMARVFERLEKHRALDAQAEIVAESLTVPFGGGVTGYDARVRVDLGDLRYTFVPRLDRLIRDERQTSTAGITDLRAERFRPFEARLSNGVFVLNGANFPLGGEVITAMARVDLVREIEQATLLIPARIARVEAFDRELIGRAISAGGSIRIDREGPLGEAEWGNPELIFDPSKVLERAVQEGLRELLRRGIGG